MNSLLFSKPNLVNIEPLESPLVYLQINMVKYDADREIYENLQIV